ncbi:MAG: hypothetical protein QM589_18145 [Thermomicrobiales bacterium]
MKQAPRLVLGIWFAISMTVFAVAGASAQGATAAGSPGADSSLLEGLRLPVLAGTFTSSGLDLPSEIAAGPTLVTLDNQTDSSVSVTFGQVPDDVSIEEFQRVVDSDDALPAWTAKAVTPGSVDAEPHATASIVLDFAPGTWTVITSTDPHVDVAATTLAATGTMQAGSADAIHADLTVAMGEYTFDFPDQVPAGPQIWRVTNNHTILHDLVLFKTPDPVTKDDVMNGLMAGMNGTPVAGAFSFETAMPVAILPVISGGESVWVEVNLAPGNYVAICFLTDPGSEMPHAAAGMIDTFVVPAS